jgi:hypothetical protein
MNRFAYRLFVAFVHLAVTLIVLSIIYGASATAWNHFCPGQPYPAVRMLLWGFASWILHDCWSCGGRQADKDFPASSSDHNRAQRDGAARPH